MNCLASVCVFYCSCTQKSNPTNYTKTKEAKFTHFFAIAVRLFQVPSWHGKRIRTPWRGASFLCSWPSSHLSAILHSCPGSSSSILFLLPSLFSPVLCPSAFLCPLAGKKNPWDILEQLAQIRLVSLFRCLRCVLEGLVYKRKELHES